MGEAEVVALNAVERAIRVLRGHKVMLDEDLATLSVISKRTGRGGRRSAPYAFTEQGVAMLSSVLRSPRAVQVNVEIMRTFVRLRQMLHANADLARRLTPSEGCSRSAGAALLVDEQERPGEEPGEAFAQPVAPVLPVVAVAGLDEAHVHAGRLEHRRERAVLVDE